MEYILFFLIFLLVSVVIAGIALRNIFKTRSDASGFNNKLLLIIFYFIGLFSIIISCLTFFQSHWGDVFNIALGYFVMLIICSISSLFFRQTTNKEVKLIVLGYFLFYLPVLIALLYLFS